MKPLALIVEDYEDQAIIFTKALERAGYETETILDGQLARQRLTEIAPDVIVLDLHLPNISGVELFRQIKADARLKTARVFLATADAAMADRLKDECDLVLLKPISFSQLTTLAARFRPGE
ncbi:MAG: response regulator [Anaerolineales bacterium]|nr:response regulator [Anaerolineales bacterium]